MADETKQTKGETRTASVLFGIPQRKAHAATLVERLLR